MKFRTTVRVKVRNALIGLFLAFSFVVDAQDTALLSRFYKEIAQSCVEMTYSYSIRVSGVNNVGSGDLCAQGLMWKMVGNGVQMYCDSTAVWVLDPSLKEVVIEPSYGDTRILTNPASLFVRMEELFKVRESRATGDSAAVLCVLEPKEKGDIDYFNVEIVSSDLSIRNASFALKDGTFIKIEVSSMKLTPMRPVEEFRPQTVFDSSWIVTDLR